MRRRKEFRERIRIVRRGGFKDIGRSRIKWEWWIAKDCEVRIYEGIWRGRKEDGREREGEGRCYKGGAG